MYMSSGGVAYEVVMVGDARFLVLITSRSYTLEQQLVTPPSYPQQAALPEGFQSAAEPGDRHIMATHPQQATHECSRC
jgi:hypothetical protein